MARRSLFVAVATIAVALGFAAPNAVAQSPYRALPVPFGFVGMNAGWPEWSNPDIDFSHQLDLMAQSGVDSLRVAFDWRGAQPSNGPSQASSDACGQVVDVGGITTDFTGTDSLVGSAAEHGMTLLPTISDAPAWDARSYLNGLYIPGTPGPYAAYVRALVLRYGSNGSFWGCNPKIPKVPVAMWQVWNEPDGGAFWPDRPHPWYVGYVPLLRAAHAAIKQADAKAKVVLAGLFDYSWIDLAQLEAHGGKGLFDVVDVHPYTRTPQGVVTILGYVRQVLNRTGGARIPMLAGEISWPSAVGQGAGAGKDFVTTEAGQAAKVGTLLPLLAGNRRRLELAGFDWYDWASLEVRGPWAFNFSGLFKYSQSTYQLYAKPAYYAYRAEALWIEGCRSKGLLATECLH